MVLDCESGDGEGESEGQELMERGSEAWLAVTDGGWINTTDTTNSLDPRHFKSRFGFLRTHNIQFMAYNQELENKINKKRLKIERKIETQ